MTIEVYSFGGEASPRRAVAAAAFLLVLSGLLAIGMSWRRAQDPLVPVLTPPDWKVRFHVPRRYVPVDARTIRRSTAMSFMGETAEGADVFCILWRGPASDRDDLRQTAEEVLEGFGVGVNWFGEARTHPPQPAPMGDVEGLELIAQSGSAAVRVARIDREVYAVLFATQKNRLDDETLRLFDLTCRSMERR